MEKIVTPVISSDIIQGVQHMARDRKDPALAWPGWSHSRRTRYVCEQLGCYSYGDFDCLDTSVQQERCERLARKIGITAETIRTYLRIVHAFDGFREALDRGEITLEQTLASTEVFDFFDENDLRDCAEKGESLSNILKEQIRLRNGEVSAALEAVVDVLGRDVPVLLTQAGLFAKRQMDRAATVTTRLHAALFASMKVVGGAGSRDSCDPAHP